MQNPLLLFFIFIITAANLLSPSLSQPLDTQGLIDKICSKQTLSDRIFCNYTLQRHLVSPQTDLAALIRITMGVASSSALTTLRFIRNLNAAEKDPNLKGTYKVCENSYNAVLPYIAAAKQNADRRNFKLMVSNLESSAKPLASCENAIEIRSGNLFYVAERNTWMRVFIRMGVNEEALL